MCGILGSVNIELQKEDLDMLLHRGPDYQELKSFELANQQVFLGHTRLSIVDLSAAGNQPMATQDLASEIVFNGEVYNHLDFRKELHQEQFNSHSDTESVLYALDEKGSEAMKLFNGIFSFCFLDKKRNKLILARDPFGVKPLYYYFDGKHFLFSSELKFVTKHIPNKKISQESLYTFMKLRYNPSPQTLFKDVFKMKPGHFLELDLNSMKLSEQQLYAEKPHKEVKMTEMDALELYEEKLLKAVERQLMSDVPISILLSGGVDSALITQLANKVSGKTGFDSFTAGYSFDSEVNELDDAKISSNFLGTNPNEVIIGEKDFLEYLPKFINIIEEPLGSQSIFPMFYLSEAIKNAGFKVVFSGQGVDEPWGGYPKYNFQNYFESIPNLPYNKSSFLRNLAKGDKFRRGLNSISEPDRIKRFVETCSVLDDYQLKDLFSDKNYLNHEEVVYSHFKSVFKTYDLVDRSPVSSLMSFDTRMNLSDDLLTYTDKISMHHSLEVRVPFLDVELIKAIETIPSKFKVGRNKNKYLHKKLAEKYLPKEIIYRKKKHFATPRKQWFREDLGKQLEFLMVNNQNIFGEIFNPTQIKRYFEIHRSGKVNFEKQIYQLVCIYYWLEIFYNDN